jgi:uncharacterized protein YjiS (DUF1127 family)
LPGRGLSRNEVEQAVRRLHLLRQPNDGDADWRIDAGRFVVLYDHPDQNDIDAARIITAWPKRRKRRRHLKLVNDENGGYPQR